MSFLICHILEHFILQRDKRILLYVVLCSVFRMTHCCIIVVFTHPNTHTHTHTHNLQGKLMLKWTFYPMCCAVLSHSVTSDSMDCSPPGASVHGNSLGKNTGVGCHFLFQCMKVKSENEVSQSSPTLSDTKDCSLPGSSVHGIFQARVLEWGAIAFSATFLRIIQQ